MSRYDGLIIPRSYSDYINKTDAATLSQALQLSGVMDAAPTKNSVKPAKSGGIYAALAEKQNTLIFDNTPTENSDNPVKSGGIFAANAVIMASGATLSGVAISAGSVVRVLFTADLTGSDATTGLQLTYNGTAYAVKVGKNGDLANFNAYEVESGVFKYLQAYTTLELMFDGTQFIIIGNPVVLSSADYTIYPDGKFIQKGTVSIFVPSHDFVLQNVNFPKVFNTAPLVFANINDTMTPYIEVTGVNISNIGTTSCKIRVYNNYNSELTVNVAWLAIQ